LDLNRLKN